MKLPTPIPFWQGSAQACAGVFSPFAMRASWRHCFHAGQGQPCQGLCRLRCYPSPSLRSGPSQAGPTLPGWQVVADCASGVKICFEIRGIAVDSNAITTTLRGSIPCASRFSSSSFFPCPWPVACRTPHRAVSPVRRRAPLSPMRPTATCLLARSLAVSPGLQPAVSRSACRLVTRATDTAAFGRTELTHRTIRATRPGGPFAFPMGGADV